MNRVYISLGGNIGDKRANFKQVREIIAAQFGNILEESSLYETPPWGFCSENYFWNQAMCIETEFEADEMLLRFKEIEKSFGQKSMDERYTDRAMDLDILYFGNVVIESEVITIPHPRIQERKFVLIPLVEIAPDFIHPCLQKTNFELLEQCKDRSVVKKIKV